MGAGVRLITGVVSFSYPLGYQMFCHSFYLTVTRSLVDMAGYVPFFATFRVMTHEAAALGALSFVPTIEHGPVSLQVFFPVEMDEISQDNGELDPFFTTDFFTMKPGRAVSFNAAVAT